MPNFLAELAQGAKRALDSGYYEVERSLNHDPTSFKRSIEACARVPIITEVKFASPVSGMIRMKTSVRDVVQAMQRGGAVGISVLTESHHFGGSLDGLAEARQSTSLPLLMKDIIISELQIEVASKLGADAILLISSLFDEGYGEADLNGLIQQAHKKGLEVLLEVHEEEEFLNAVKTKADLIGINNRSLKTLKLSLNTTAKLLARHGSQGHIVVSESGIKTPEDIRRLRQYGAHAFLVGTEVMASPDIEAKVRELVSAL